MKANKLETNAIHRLRCCCVPFCFCFVSVLVLFVFLCFSLFVFVCVCVCVLLPLISLHALVSALAGGRTCPETSGTAPAGTTKKARACEASRSLHVDPGPKVGKHRAHGLLHTPATKRNFASRGIPLASFSASTEPHKPHKTLAWTSCRLE